MGQNKKDRYEEWNNDPSNWKWFVFYYNPKDTRVFVPKRTKLGWTINFANAKSVIVIVGLIILFLILSEVLVLI